jgi:Cu2+-exporting ATPase
MKTSVIKVHDMLSVLSVTEVEKRIGEVPGVESVTVNFAAESATVRYDETRLDVADIRSDVRQAGYESDAHEGHTVPDAPKTSTVIPMYAVPKSVSDATPADDEQQDKAALNTAPLTPAPSTPKANPVAPMDHAMHDHADHEHKMPEDAKSGHMDHGAMKHGGHADHAGMVTEYKKRFWICLALTLPVLALSPMIQQFLQLGDSLRFQGDMYILAALSSAIYFYGGIPFFKGLVAEVRGKLPGMMTLVAIAITSAYLYSVAIVLGLPGMDFFWELATLVDIMLFGHWIEMKSVMGAGDALEKLAKLMPSNAHKVMPDGSIQEVSLDQLKMGDQFLVKPGEKVPADGKIIKGGTSLNESMLTGESKPVEKAAGANVIGGSINGEGSITVEVTKASGESFLSQVIGLVKQAQESKSKTQDFANRAAFWLTMAALIIGIGSLVAWLAFSGQPIAFALERMVSVMVVACPHALGLAVPLVVAVSTAIAAQHGLLIRDRTAFEAARNINAIIFDKTGTLTKGEFGITDVLLFDSGMTEDELVAYAASVESNSEHPIAQGIVKSAKEHWNVDNFKAISGKGAEGTVGGRKVMAVSPGYLKENNIPMDDPRYQELSGQGKTVIFVLIDGKLAGAIALADIIRPESKEAIKRLKEMKIKCIMLTGDNKQVADWVGKEIGLDEVIAEVLPQAKVAKIKEVQARGLIVAMTGDGVNDAPALAQSDVGIAIGAGTDVAIETADIILVKSNPLDVVAVIGLARATYRKMIQNLIWATGYNTIAIPLAAGVLYPTFGIVLNPAFGAVLMAGSTIVCAVNAKMLRLKK